MQAVHFIFVGDDDHGRLTFSLPDGVPVSACTKKADGVLGIEPEDVVYLVLQCVNFQVNPDGDLDLKLVSVEVIEVRRKELPEDVNLVLLG